MFTGDARALLNHLFCEQSIHGLHPLGSLCVTGTTLLPAINNSASIEGLVISDAVL